MAMSAEYEYGGRISLKRGERSVKGPSSEWAGRAPSGVLGEPVSATPVESETCACVCVCVRESVPHYLSVCLSVCLLSVCLSPSLPLSLSLSLSFSLSLSLSPSLSLCSLCDLSLLSLSLPLSPPHSLSVLSL